MSIRDDFEAIQDEVTAQIRDLQLKFNVRADTLYVGRKQYYWQLFVSTQKSPS